MGQIRTIRIVVASPSDVQPERDVLPHVLEELNRGIAAERGLRLELSRWETDVYPGFHPDGAQGLIDPILRIEDCDVLIGIFWKRFGTPTMDAQSGTEHEILRAYEAWKNNRSPQIMIYFNRKSYSPNSKEELDQWGRVLEFRERFPREGLWWSYKGKSQFERLVRTHLTNFIRHNLPPPSLSPAFDKDSSTEAGHIHEETTYRNEDEIGKAYRDNLEERVGKVYIFGDKEPRELTKVFVELNIKEDYERPSIQTHWLGAMDAEFRKRSFITREIEHAEGRMRRTEGAKSARALKPDDLIRERTRAVIVGAPGCGKTTLLKYLTLESLKRGERFPIFLELKTISEQAITEAKGKLSELLFEQAVAKPLHLYPREYEILKRLFFDHLAASEVSIFLDGLDEVSGTEFYTRLCSLISDFTHSDYRDNDLILSTRPYALQVRFEGLNELEIAPLNQQQMEDFVSHYYFEDPATLQFLPHLRRRHELQGIARVPFLLAVIAYLYRQQGEIVGERLELYRLIIQQLVIQLDREKPVAKRFYIFDPEGFLKKEFLKKLAFDRLFVDQVEKDAERLIFTSEDILKKAQSFCRPEVRPDLLAADVKATPLLREVGSDAYAFAHLTIQEYLAALALSGHSDCEKLFCRNYFEPTLAEMEVLPMALGLMGQQDELYTTLEGLPESLTFIGLRLRIRGFTYGSKISIEHRAKLSDWLIQFITNVDAEEMPYLDAICRSYSATNSQDLEMIVDRITPLLHADRREVCERAIEVLGRIGGDESVGVLIDALDNSNVDVKAAEALGLVGGEQAMEALTIALLDAENYTSDVRGKAAEALGQIGGEEAVGNLLDALGDEDLFVREKVVEALESIGGERAIEGLLEALRHDDDVIVRRSAAEALGRNGGEPAVAGLLDALTEDQDEVSETAAEALVVIGGEEVVEGLIKVLDYSHSDACWRAVDALEQIGGDRSVFGLIKALADDESDVRERAADALVQASGEQVIIELTEALNDENRDIRLQMVEILERIGGEQAVAGLRQALQDDDEVISRRAAEGLKRIGKDQEVTSFVNALSGGGQYDRKRAVEVLIELADSRAAASLIRSLDDDNPDIRLTALESLIRIRDPRAVTGIVKALTDNNPSIRTLAANALEEIGGVGTTGELLTAIETHDEDTLRSAIDALRHITEEDRIVRLIDELNSVGFRSRESAAKALVRLRGEGVAAMLFNILDDSDRAVRRSVAEMLVRINHKGSVTGWLELLRDEDRSVRGRAAKALVQIGDQRAIDGLFKALRDRAHYVRSRATEALVQIGGKLVIDGLLKALRDDDTDVCERAATALAGIGGEQAIGGLLKALTHSNPRVRKRATDALWQIGSDQVVVGVLEILKRNDLPVRETASLVLSQLHTRVLSAGLYQALSHKNHFVRQKAAKAVGYYATETKVLDELIRLSDTDPFPEVKTAANEARNKYERKLQYLS